MKRKGIRIATIGCNFGPYSNNLGIKLTEWELRCNDLITVRDKYSYNLIKEFKRVNNYYLVDDIVYNYNNIIYNNKREGLGISAYRSMRTKENNYDNYEALAKIADNYISKTGKRVSLFAFNSEQENDLSAAHHILNLSNEKEYIDIVPYIGNQDELINTFKSCERIIAIRFHSAILADIFQIPFLPIAYSNKMENLVNDRNFHGEIIRIEDLNIELDFEDIVNKIVSGEGLFNKFLEDKGSSNIHFDQLEKILKNEINN